MTRVSFLRPAHAASRKVLAALMLTAGGTLCATGPGGPPHVSVKEVAGTYTVSATFEISRSPATALAVLTDYAQIPRFMPDVRTTVVRRRSEGRALVEQEAVSKFMMFSKRIHLVLDIVEGPERIEFVDRCGRSFKRYEGRWIASEHNGRSLLSYQLVAEPAFDVPEFILKRLLRRDAGEMIERLQREIASR